MVLMSGDAVALGSSLPAFSVFDVETQKTITQNAFSGQPLCIALMCNHCPYVLRIINQWRNLLNKYHERIPCLMVSSNDVNQYPQDGPEHMLAFKMHHKLQCVYANDESQSLARDLQGRCTPDFYVYDAAGLLYYHGALVYEGQPVLQKAFEALLNGNTRPLDQPASQGCSIKWSTR